MSPLKKYIRPSILRSFLRKAFEMTEEKCPHALVYEGEIVFVEGVDIDAFRDTSEQHILSASLFYDAYNMGEIRVRVPGDASSESIEQYKRSLRFSAYSIQELINMESTRRSIAEDALAKYRELAVLHRSVPVINTSLRLRDVLATLINECRKESYPGEVGMVFLADPGTVDYRLAIQFGLPFGANPQSLVESRLFHEVLSSHHGEIVNDLKYDDRWENEVVHLRSMALIPIVSPNRIEGMLVLASENAHMFDSGHHKSLVTLASVAGISVSNAFNLEGIQTLMNAILQALAEAIDSRDPFTAGHSERVAHLAVATAFLLGQDPRFMDVSLNDEALREIYYAGILHDVGKIGIREEVLTKRTRLSKKQMDILRGRFHFLAQTSDFNWVEAFEVIEQVNTSMTPDEHQLDVIRELSKLSWLSGDESCPLLHKDELEVLLLKYGNLTQEERREIQRHPAESERILQHIPLQEGYSNLLTIIRQHHERLDGSGYPDGIRGDEILLQSRIMAIVDIYDAVTQERHYKPARTQSEAWAILTSEANEGRLDATLVDFFLFNLEEIEKLSRRVKTTRATQLSSIGSWTENN